MSDTTTATTNKNMEKHFFRASAEDFKKIPGSPIAYWVSPKIFQIFSTEISLGNKTTAKQGLATGNNDIFVRLWFEVKRSSLCLTAKSCEETSVQHFIWYPYNKGGKFRKWFGNIIHVVNWENDGLLIRQYRDNKGKLLSRPQNTNCYFREGITWSDVTSGFFSTRYLPNGNIYDISGHSAFPDNEKDKLCILAFTNTSFCKSLAKILNPTLHFQIGDFCNLPYPSKFIREIVVKNTTNCVQLAQNDWNSYETSWDFTTLPLLHPDHHHPTLEQTYTDLRAQWQDTTLEMQRLEEENNRVFIDAYGLQDELTPDVPLEEITLTCNPRYRYGRGKTDEDYETLLRCDTVKELISYAVGCMMGRYSLDEPGLVYAHSGNQGFDPDRYQTFPADEDGILPVMDLDWFDDDAARRLSAFIQCLWPEQHLDDNLAFIAECLVPRAAESPLDTLRRYLSTTFFKDHMRTYKKRPIYWLFSSGRQKAFTCIVYLHRYHPATLSRMRSHYVTPLQGKMAARMEFLDHEREAAGTPSAQKKIQKQMDLLKKKQAELNLFDDELRHYADMKIDLDLDDGVKINYAKFGNLLAERKAITGK
jgi:type II restriction/modification system DNA methylase subunit YeeA